MTLTFSDLIIGIVLFTCVPLQYFLVQNWGSVSSNRQYALTKIYNQVTNFYNEYLTLSSWKKWIVIELGLEDIFPHIISPYPDDDIGESPAIEVWHYKHKHGYFSFSQDPRLVRSPDVEFRVGQVVKHKLSKYRGVIIGWDEIAKAPPEWFSQMHGKDILKAKEMPNYYIIVDTRDRLIPQLTYVPQVNLEVIESQIIHPLLEDNFESFDGVQYKPRPWLKALYPQD